MKYTFLFVFTLLSFLLSAQVEFQEHTIIDKNYGNYRPREMATADLNNDGFIDVISQSDINLVWYKNLDGNGNFSNANTLIDNSPVLRLIDVEAFDVDNDNDNDIIFSNSEGIHWLENTDGFGSFGTPQLIKPANGSSYIIQIIDINGDGITDIGYYKNNILGWAENNGTGSFVNHDIITNASTLKNIHFTDIDNDGKADYIIASGYNLRWYKQDNSDNFNFVATLSTFAQSKQLTSADIDNDGDMDIISVFENGVVDKKIKWCENLDGQGNFSTYRTLVTIPNLITSQNYIDILHLEIDDLDGDGNKDLLLNWPSINDMFWYRNLGNDSFSTEQFVNQDVEKIRSSKIIDIDQDGDKDIVFSNVGDHTVSWLENIDGLGDFSHRTLISTLASNVKKIDKGDLDNDGDLDVISFSWNDGKLAWYENTDGMGNFTKKQKIIYATKNNTLLSGIDGSIVDINNDGVNDILSLLSVYVPGGVDTKINWFERDVTGHFIAHSIDQNNDKMHFIAGADIDNDNDIDIVCVAGSETSDDVFVYRNNGNGTFAAKEIIASSIVRNPKSLELSDINGDGNVDILLGLAYNDTITWFDNVGGNGTFTVKHTIANDLSNLSETHAVDLDGDLDLDLIFSTRNNEVGYFENLDGQGNFGSKTIVANLNNSYSVLAYDIDNDGDKDLVSNSTNVHEIVWIENNGALVFGTPQVITQNATKVNSMIEGDFNADGKTDLLMGAIDDNKIAWYENLGENFNNINGIVKYDIDNSSCATNSIIIPNALITTSNSTDSFSTFTNQNGIFHFPVNIDEFNTEITTPYQNYTSYPLSYTTLFNDLGNTENLNFCMQPNTVFNDLNIAIYPLNTVRPGFSTTFRVLVSNTGTDLINTTFSFDYDGAKMNYTTSSTAPISQTTNQLSYPVDIMPFETKTIDIEFINLSIPIINLRELLSYTATLSNNFTDENPSDNTFELIQEVTGSYDPNDITVLEGNKIRLIDAQEYLHYIIRFQNTGNSFAQRIHVTNVLDDKLDFSTLKIESTSHNMNVEILNGNEIDFIFNAIYLPESSFDEQKSHGFIAYKIKPKSNVVNRDIFTNNAAIYFDFNPAINTNIVTTEIDETLAVKQESLNIIRLTPNPSSNFVKITSDTFIELIKIYDINGKLIKSIHYNERPNTIKLFVGDIINGMYFIKIKSKNHVLIKKLVKI